MITEGADCVGVGEREEVKALQHQQPGQISPTLLNPDDDYGDDDVFETPEPSTPPSPQPHPNTNDSNGSSHHQSFQNSSQTKRTTDKDQKISGYLEKRSKILGWKKFWFVLDGRLLTYYKSKSEYNSLSACIGSINLGIATIVRPVKVRGCKGLSIQIVTRSQLYYLKAGDKTSLEHWLFAIQEAASDHQQTGVCSTITSPDWKSEKSGKHSDKSHNNLSCRSLSQWSLQLSTEDLTQSLIYLSTRQLQDSNNYFNQLDSASPVLSKLHKCHSYSSLQHSGTWNYLKRNKSRSKMPKNKVGQGDKNGNVFSFMEPFDTITEETGKFVKGVKGSPASKEKTKNTAESPRTLDTQVQDDDSSPKDNFYDEIIDFEETYGRKLLKDDDIDCTEHKKISEQQEDLETCNPVIYEPVEGSDLKTGHELVRNLSRMSQKSISSKQNSISTLSEGQNPEEKLISSPPKISNLPRRSLTFERNKEIVEGQDSLSEKSKSNGKLRFFGKAIEKLFRRKGKDKKKKIQDISGPVDLKCVSPEEENKEQCVKKEPIKPAHSFPIDISEVKTVQLKKSNSFAVRGSPAVTSHERKAPKFGSLSSRESIIDELKQRVEQRKESIESVSSSKSNLLLEKIESKRRSLLQTEVEGEEQEPKDFKEKLAKFNSLSKKFDLQDDKNLSRSSSLKIPEQNKKDDLVIPAIPLKRRNTHIPSPTDINTLYTEPTRITSDVTNSKESPVSLIEEESDDEPTYSNINAKPISRERLSPEIEDKLSESGLPHPLYETAEKISSKKDEDLSSGSYSANEDGPQMKIKIKSEEGDSPIGSSNSNVLEDTIDSELSDTYTMSGNNSPEAGDEKIILRPNELAVELKSTMDANKDRIYGNIISKVETIVSGFSSKLEESSENQYDMVDSCTNSPQTDNIMGDTPDIYQNVRYATEETLAQEYETVVEQEPNEDESSELYDEFPDDFSDLKEPIYNTPVSTRTLTGASQSLARLSRIRNSGMQALEESLKQGYDQMSDSGVFSDSLEKSIVKDVATSPFQFDKAESHASGCFRTGAISRLGHSPAITSLKNLLENE